MKTFPRRQQFLPSLISLAGALYLLVQSLIFLGQWILGRSSWVKGFREVLSLLVILTLGALFTWFDFPAAQRIELTRQELRVKIGPLVLRRIPTEKIRTVSVSCQSGVNWLEKDRVCLVLSDKTPERLDELGYWVLENPKVRHNMSSAGIPVDGKYAAARAYLYARMCFCTLWLDATPEVRTALEEMLPDALFLF